LPKLATCDTEFHGLTFLACGQGWGEIKFKRQRLNAAARLDYRSRTVLASLPRIKAVPLDSQSRWMILAYRSTISLKPPVEPLVKRVAGLCSGRGEDHHSPPVRRLLVILAHSLRYGRY